MRLSFVVIMSCCKHTREIASKNNHQSRITGMLAKLVRLTHLSIKDRMELQSCHFLPSRVLASSRLDFYLRLVSQAMVVYRVKSTLSFITSHNCTLAIPRISSSSDHFVNVSPVCHAVLWNIPDAKLLIEGAAQEKLYFSQFL